MIRVTQTSANGRMQVTVEGDTVEDVFEKLGEATEVFFVTAAAKQHGKVVESDDIRFVTRVVDDNKFHEAIVVSGPMRGYKLAYGSKKKPKGSLFPKRKIPEENVIPGLGGWSKWKKPEATEEQAVPTETSETNVDKQTETSPF